MKGTHSFIKLFAYLIFTIATFCCNPLQAQNCTVNAGLDGSACYSGVNNNYAYDIFTLNGNSAGNFDTTANLLWELASAPIGAIVTFQTPNINTTKVKAMPNQLPSGTYIFRLGINCQTGGRIYDSVTYIISNVSDFSLNADKKWEQICAGSQDSMKLVGRPLKAGEIVRITGRSISITYNNSIYYPNADFYGPTTDSVRFIIKSSLSNDCTLAYWPYVKYDIRLGSCRSYTTAPYKDGLADVTIPQASILKTGFRNITDTISCISSDYFNIYPNNICIKGGRGSFNAFSSRTLLGSGSIYSVSTGGNSLEYIIQNKWDTVRRNSLHVYEITIPSNGCMPTFIDTIKIFFKSTAPTSTGLMSNTSENFCINPSSFPLSNFKSALSITGTIPPSYKLVSTIYGPAGSSVSITNPYALDTVNVIGTNIIAGQYYISTNVIDTITGCFSIVGYKILNFTKKASLPVLRDTSVCTLNNFYVFIPYKSASFPLYEYRFSVLNGPQNNNLIQNIYTNTDSTIQITVYPSTTPPGIYTIRMYPNTGSTYCNDGRSDTFQIEIKSGGRISNAGTDQILLCNFSSTNLAGSLPSAGGGQAGFWKFLPAISINAATAPIIADSSNRNTLITGFTNLSSNYFSWNVTDGNSGNYCGLKPDTVLVVYSGIPPSTPQHAQADFFGALAANGNYMLTSNAVTPTFNVQWSKISGVGGTIASPNNQNTNVSGLMAGNYVFELVVTNTCGVFKDTVNLYFSSAGNLPVKLLSFGGSRKNETTDMLVWQVADEINMKYYEVQISDNGYDFKTTGTVAISNSSSNNKTYEFTNTITSSSVNFYRLKMINMDGSFAYSNILKLSNKQKNINTLDVMPNPAKANLFVHITSAQAHSSTIEIINLLGQIIFKKYVQTIKGVNSIPVDVSNLPRGVFFLKVEDMIKKLILE
jgi:Secretion system C-terminal sorting domain